MKEIIRKQKTIISKLQAQVTNMESPHIKAEEKKNVIIENEVMLRTQGTNSERRSFENDSPRTAPKKHKANIQKALN